MNSGIYEIVNAVNGKRYIGAAKNFSARWRAHKSDLRRNKHHSSKLQNAWNKYGEAAFEFRVLIRCAATKGDLISAEQHLMDTTHPEYNICKKADSPLGVKHRPEVCAAVSARMTGKKRGPHSAAHRAAISKALQGREITPLWREHMAEAQRGQKRAPFSEAHRANMSKAQTGHAVSDAARQRMSESHKGKVQSAETKAKRAAALRGNTNSLGCVHTPEQDQNRVTNHKLTFRGETFCVAEWARRIGIKERTLLERLRHGWSTEQTLGTPLLVRGAWSKLGKHGQHKRKSAP